MEQYTKTIKFNIALSELEKLDRIVAKYGGITNRSEVLRFLVNHLTAAYENTQEDKIQLTSINFKTFEEHLTGCSELRVSNTNFLIKLKGLLMDVYAGRKDREALEPLLFALANIKVPRQPTVLVIKEEKEVF